MILIPDEWQMAIQVVFDPLEPIVDPNTGLAITSRPTAFGKYLNTKFVNVAAKYNGGTAKAAFSQDMFDVGQAIDGITTGHMGWAYHGRLDKAIAMFTFKQDYRVSRIRLLSGVGRFIDHHVTAFQVWYSNTTSVMMPPAVHWFPHYYWQPVIDMQPVTLDTVVVGNRVFTNGEEEVVLKFSPVRALAFLIKVDAADSPGRNAVITEFEVFTADADEPSAPAPLGVPEFVDHSWVAPPPRALTWKTVETIASLPGGQTQLLLPAPDTDVVPYKLWTDRTAAGGNKSKAALTLSFSQGMKDLGFDASREMRRLCNGRWFTPLHPKVPYMQMHLRPSKVWSWCREQCTETPIALEGQAIHVPASETCAALNGTEILYLGDTRTRQHFLATVAYLRGVNLRGYSNPGHPHYHGQINDNFWHPPGRAEACGPSMPQGFELECAGVVGGMATLCNGTVTLRLEELDDWGRMANRLAHWMEVRRKCEEVGRCGSPYMLVVASQPIPGIRAFSSVNPVRPSVPMVNVTARLGELLGLMEPVWAASADRNAWFAAGGGPLAAAGRTALVWVTTEPFALTEPLHSGHNRNITNLNADARHLLDVVGVPVLDAFRLTLERFDCSPDGLHWCATIHNTKAGMLLTFARQLVEKLRLEEGQARTPADRLAEAARAVAVAREVQLAEAAEQQRVAEEDQKRLKAIEQARALKRQQEEELRKQKQAEVDAKLSKFKSRQKQPGKAGAAAGAAAGGKAAAGAAAAEACAGETCSSQAVGGTCSASASGEGTCSASAGGGGTPAAGAPSAASAGGATGEGEAGVML